MNKNQLVSALFALSLMFLFSCRDDTQATKNMETVDQELAKDLDSMHTETEAAKKELEQNAEALKEVLKALN